MNCCCELDLTIKPPVELTGGGLIFNDLLTSMEPPLAPGMLSPLLSSVSATSSILALASISLALTCLASLACTPVLHGADTAVRGCLGLCCLFC